MASEVYIGTEKCDFSGDVSVVFSGGDLRDITEGSVNSSYEITLPITGKNKRLLQYSDAIDCFSEITDTGYIFINGTLILKGRVIVIGSDSQNATIIIQGSEWYDYFADKMMNELDLSVHDHEYSAANIEDSWTGGTKFYRYAMIFMAQLFSEETSTTANWLPNDFIPMFRLVDILTEIFKPFTIAGDWLTDVAEVYLLGREPQAEASYIDDKNFDVSVNSTADNIASDTINVGQTKDILFTERTIDFNNITDNDGSRFSTSTNRYHIPETGTYYFKFIAQPNWTATNKGNLTINAQRIYLRMYRLRGATTTLLETLQVDYTSTDIINLQQYTINSRHSHFESGDYAWVTVQMYQNLTNTGGVTQTVNMFLTTTTKFELVWDKRCLCLGLGKTISAVDFMPDVSQINFVKAVKEAYNLRFTPDLFRRIIYIEGGDRILTDNEKSLTGIDSINFSTENISRNYSKNIRLKLKCDTSDGAVKSYLMRNAEPYIKDITLNGVYAKNDIDTMENSLFAFTISGNMWFMSSVIDCIRIYGDGDIDEYPYYPLYRSNNFQPRILKWDGLTSGTTWYFDGSAKTSYPKATTIDMQTLYATYFQKTLHLIDRGKIVIVEGKVDVLLLQQFIAVVSDIDNEGFRAMYKIAVNGKYLYGYLNRIEFNGVKMRLELIIKH